VADKKLSLVFDTKLGPGGDEAFRRLGDSARQAEQPVSSLMAGVRGIRDELKSLTAAAATAAGRLSFTGQSDLQLLRSQSLANERLRHVSRTYAPGLPDQKLNVEKTPSAFETVGGLLGLPTNVSNLAGAFAALTATVKASDKALSVYQSSMYRGQFHEGAFADTILKGLQNHLPATAGTVLGEDSGFRARIDALKGLWDWKLDFKGAAKLTRQFYSGEKEGATAEDRTSMNIRQERTRNLAETAETAARMARLQTEKLSRVRPLAMERTQREALLGLGHTSERDTFRIQQAANAALYQRFGKAGRTLGYTREAEMSDVGLRIRTQAAYEQASVEGKRKAGVLSAKQERAGKTVREQQELYSAQQIQVAHAYEAVNRARSPEQELNARLGLERQYADLLEQEKRLREAMNEKLALDREAVDQSLGLQREKVRLVKAEGDAIAAARQAEQALVQSQRESLGLMHPAQLRTALGVARKHKGGQHLTQGEIGFMQSHSAIFGQQLKQIGAERFAANNNVGQMMRELSQLTGYGGTARMQQLDKLQVANDVRVKIELGNTDLIMNQLEKHLVPALQQMEKRIMTEIGNMIARDRNLMQANRHAIFGS